MDSNEADPFEDKKRRQEREVKGLLDKVSFSGDPYALADSCLLDTTRHDRSGSRVCGVIGTSYEIDDGSA